jgi:hypothetical protein
MARERAVWVDIVCCSMYAATIGFILHGCIHDKEVEKLKLEAIERGHAEVDDYTGEWQWKDE